MSHIDIKHHKHHKTVIGNSPYFRHPESASVPQSYWHSVVSCFCLTVHSSMSRRLNASSNLQRRLSKSFQSETCTTLNMLNWFCEGCEIGGGRVLLEFLEFWLFDVSWSLPVVSSRSKAVRKPTLRSGSILIPQGIGWTKRKGFAGGPSCRLCQSPVRASPTRRGVRIC